MRELPKWWPSKTPYIIGDCMEGMNGLPDGVMDFILTDPPYGINKEGVVGDANLDAFSNSLPEISRLLKNDAWVVFFVPNGRLDEILKIMPFKYVWTCMVFYSNMERINHSPIGRSMTSLYLVFKKGSPKVNKRIWDIQKYVYSGEDVVPHPSPKPSIVFERLCTAFCKEDGIVFDPFLGSGTTLLAARKTKRIGLGYEINREYEGTIRNRGMLNVRMLDV